MASDLTSKMQPGGFMPVDRFIKHPGANIWWVDSTTGTDAAANGKTIGAPCATIAYAVALAAATSTAGVDDTIYIKPGHAETIGASAAAALTLSIAGLRVIGLGGPARKPAVLIDAYDDTYVSITGADTVLENIQFTAGHKDIAYAIAVAADGVELRKLSFRDNTTNENFVECITDGGATADMLLIEQCEFQTVDADGTAGIQLDAAQDRVVIIDNAFHGDWGTGAISVGAAATYITVARNVVYNLASDADSGITLANNTSGICVLNMVGNGAATPSQLTSGDTTVCENYGNITTSDLNGTLEPIAT